MSTKAKPKKASKVAPTKSAKTATQKSPSTNSSNRGIRYTPELKKEVVDFVHSHNAKHGRGGQSAASRKFKISVLTVASWLRGSSPSSTPTATGSKGLAKKVQSLLDLSEKIRKAETELAKLKDQHAVISTSIRSLL